ncbi:PTS sugar transporter subunit IIB [Bacillus solimangrovi]|uniref:PTS sugar transporter subunit IIB n=1 Tax=Bacillus solimangrovi TaxID=1305675 RepID=A0A1E5LBR1_9BACI|nr:PTS sugar transporter subunit IIB [Bacillus solimangrovi]OEH91535.1 PTS sugar transporter subunit IIB [Bacillus solimangrovi]
MVKIGLFCAAGMSTSMLVTKMKNEAKAKGIDVEINAYPESELEKVIDNIDVALLGPQVKFLLTKAKAVCEPKNIPVEVINTMDYGMMNGAKVLESALNLVKK